MMNHCFVNPHAKKLKKSLWHFLLWRLGYYDDPSLRLSPPRDFSYPASPKKWVPGSPSAVWIGHSTYLIEIEGIRILTDPVWDDYCSPIRMQALQRKVAPPIALRDLPSIDIVLISHNHYDHLDVKTIKTLHRMQPHIRYVVPEKLSPWFTKKGIFSVYEIPWWQSLTLGKAKIFSVPTQHFSGRGLFDTNKTHWNGYVVETCGKRIYFTGDTGYNSKDFKEIGRRFSYMDLSLIPIGTYSPRKFMSPVHIAPEEAVQIHEEVRSKLSLGMHWKTFRLSEEPMDRPPFDLYKAMKEKKLPFETFLPIDIGQYVNF